MIDTGSLDHRIMDLVGTIPYKNKYHLLHMLEDWRQSRNRIDHRDPCLIPVDILDRDRVYRDFISNLSDSGAFIETRISFVEGQPVALTFSESDPQKHHKIDGVVIRNDARGVAVKFNKKLNRDRDIAPQKGSRKFIRIVKSSVREN